ncbi:MAG: hypothetical protein WBF54_15400 [Terriglobales bacterium]
MTHIYQCAKGHVVEKEEPARTVTQRLRCKKCGSLMLLGVGNQPHPILKRGNNYGSHRL